MIRKTISHCCMAWVTQHLNIVVSRLLNEYKVEIEL